MPELRRSNRGGSWKVTLTLNTLALTIGQLLGCPRDIPHESKSMPNQVAANQLWEDERAYRKQALEWAIKDNSGYGMVQFQDLRLAAIQSCLLVRNAMPYECHIFCKARKLVQFRRLGWLSYYSL